MRRDDLESDVEAYGVACRTGNKVLIAYTISRLQSAFKRLPDELPEAPPVTPDAPQLQPLPGDSAAGGENIGS